MNEHVNVKISILNVAVAIENDYNKEELVKRTNKLIRDYNTMLDDNRFLLKEIL